MKIKQRFCLPFHHHSTIIPRCQVPSVSMVPSFLFQLWSVAVESPLIQQPPSDSTFQSSAKQSISNSEKNKFNPSLSLCWCQKTPVCSFVPSRLDYCNSLLAGFRKYLHNLTMFLHICMHFTGFQSINESTTKSLPAAFLLSLAPVINTLPTFSRLMFLPNGSIPPLTFVCFKYLLSSSSLSSLSSMP